jgi:hypothetical protein
LRTGISVGSLVGITVLYFQPPLPALRVGYAPLVAAAVGTVAAQVYLLADDSDDRFADLWDDLARDGDER